MKTFSTYLEYKEKMSISQWMKSLFQVYQIDDDIALTKQRMIQDHLQIYQYPQDHSVVVQMRQRLEYIYNEEEGCLCIHNDGSKEGYRYIDEGLEKGLWKDDVLPISDKPIKICHDNYQLVIQWLESSHRLPIVYINYLQIVDPDYLAQQLRGIAHVLYEENSEIHELLQKHCQLVPQYGKVAIYYLNNDYKIYRFSKKESQDQLQQRVLHNLILFLKQRQYGERYDFHSLQKRYLEDLKLQASDYEQETVFQLDQQMKKLEDEKKRYVELIERLENDVMLLQMQNDQIEEELSSRYQYALLAKGGLKEFYQSEQKDVLLDMLEDDVKKKNTGDLDIEILEDILKQNPKEGTREEYLDHILKQLLNGRSIYKLKSWGIEVKGEMNKHPLVAFFDDPRYQSTVSSTPSDVNACRQIYRQFRKYFF